MAISIQNVAFIGWPSLAVVVRWSSVGPPWPWLSGDNPLSAVVRWQLERVGPVALDGRAGLAAARQGGADC